MTIKGLADRVGVTKTAIRKRMDEAFRANYVTLNADGSLDISESGCEVIENSFRKPAETLQKQAETSENKFAETAENKVSAELVALLREQLSDKDKEIEKIRSDYEERISEYKQQLDVKDKQIERTQAMISVVLPKRKLRKLQNNQSNVFIEGEIENTKKGFFARLFGRKKDNV